MFPYRVVDDLSFLFFELNFVPIGCGKALKLITVLGLLLVLTRLLTKFLSNILAQRISSNAVINTVGKVKVKVFKNIPRKVCHCSGISQISI